MIIEDFGTLSNGKECKLYTLQTPALDLSVTDYGTTLVNLIVKDGAKRTDIVLGFTNAKDYETKNDPCFGCNVGRNANRIKTGKFTLNNVAYSLDQNDGKNNLHSGNNPYFKRIWNVETYDDNHITFSLNSPNMDQGFPGEIKVFVTYKIINNNSFEIIFEGIPKEDTIINITNHSYFNLNGEGSGSVLDHSVQIFADYYTPANRESIPLGTVESVKNTPMDFTSPKKIGLEIENDFQQLIYGKGYDHNFVTVEPDKAVKYEDLPYNGKLHKIVEATGDKSGIKLSIETDYPGVQMYTANYVENISGKNGHVYNQRTAVCFEPQFFPDAINNANFISSVCPKHKTFKKHILYTLNT